RIGLRSRTGKRLGGSAVHEILRDPLYKGAIRFDGVVAKGRHEPTVGEAVWERVQSALTSRRRGTGKPKDRGLRELFVFGNLLRCPRCGRALCPSRVKGKYVYSGGRNPLNRGGGLVPRPARVEQLPPLFAGIRLGNEAQEALRERL